MSCNPSSQTDDRLNPKHSPSGKLNKGFLGNLKMTLKQNYQSYSLKRLHNVNSQSCSEYNLNASVTKKKKCISTADHCKTILKNAKKTPKKLLNTAVQIGVAIAISSNKRNSQKSNQTTKIGSPHKTPKSSPLPPKDKKIEVLQCRTLKKHKHGGKVSKIVSIPSSTTLDGYKCSTQGSYARSPKSPKIVSREFTKLAPEKVLSPSFNNCHQSQEISKISRRRSKRRAKRRRKVNETVVKEDLYKSTAQHLTEKSCKLKSPTDETHQSHNLCTTAPKKGQYQTLQEAAYKYSPPRIYHEASTDSTLHESSSEPTFSERKIHCRNPLSPTFSRDSAEPIFVGSVKKDHSSISPDFQKVSNTNLNSSSDFIMEVDADGGEDKISSTESLDKLIAFVADTNILISHISLLDTIKMKEFNDMKVVIVIPYAAIQELDDLKQRKPIAQKAIRWCNEHFECGNSCIQGQSFEDYMEAAALYGGITGDDKIRDCCLFYKKKGFNVCLLTNDINLRNKAILSKLQVTDSTKLRELIDSGSFHLKGFEKVELEDEVSNCSNCPKSPAEKVSDTNNNGLSLIKESLRQTLTPIIEHAMKDAYGDIWETIVVYKPPWDAYATLQCIKRHWIAVFMDKFPNVVEDCIKALLGILSSKSPDLHLAKNLKKRVSSLFMMLGRTKYKEFIKDLESPQKGHSEAPTCGDTVQRCEESHFRNVVLALGRNATEIFAALLDKVESLGMDDTLWTSLENLKNVLVSLGFTLVRILNEPTLEALTSVNQELCNYWNCAKEPSCYQVLHISDLDFLSEGNDGKNFLQACTKEFERIINEIHSLK